MIFSFFKKKKHSKVIEKKIGEEIHVNEDQVFFNEKLESEGKYQYELIIKGLNDEQIKYIKSQFEEYTWDMGFAVIDYLYKHDGDLFKIVFDSKKYFDADDKDFDDKALAQNIVSRIIGKEQFICNVFWDSDLEEKDIVFIDDKKNEWVVEVGKYGDINQLLKDKKRGIEAVKENGLALKNASDSLKADRELVLEAVKEDGGALEYADESLKADREVVLEAVKDNGDALQYADNSLKADREVVLEAVKEYGNALEHADNSLKADREVVLEAVKSVGSALDFANDSLKADPELRKLATE